MKRFPASAPPLISKVKTDPAPLGAVFLRELVVRRGDEAGMADGFDALVPVQEFDGGLRVGQMPLHPERKGLQPLS